MRKVQIKNNPLGLDAYVNGDPKLEKFSDDTIMKLANILEQQIFKDIDAKLDEQEDTKK